MQSSFGQYGGECRATGVYLLTAIFYFVTASCLICETYLVRRLFSIQATPENFNFLEGHRAGILRRQRDKTLFFSGSAKFDFALGVFSGILVAPERSHSALELSFP